MTISAACERALPIATRKPDPNLRRFFFMRCSGELPPARVRGPPTKDRGRTRRTPVARACRRVYRFARAPLRTGECPDETSCPPDLRRRELPRVLRDLP